MLSELIVGKSYSNEGIFKALQVSNAGGIRIAVHGKAVVRAAIMTSIQDFHVSGENPYHDRLEGDILTYTAAGKKGEQSLSGTNRRVIEQRDMDFPIHGFVLVASRRDKSVGPERWNYLGLLEYLRHYPDTQVGSDDKVRKVWIFEFRVHPSPSEVPITLDASISRRTLAESRSRNVEVLADSQIVDGPGRGPIENFELIERIRGKLLSMEPRRFEIFIRDLLAHSGFTDVCVTKYSADGGIDVNARAGARILIFENTLVQVQAKRWLHSVGRKEVAELRGSLQLHAKGAVITTSHFSKAAINEAGEEGKTPIALIDGYRLSKVVFDENFAINL